MEAELHQKCDSYMYCILSAEIFGQSKLWVIAVFAY